jgi:predicted alpha/beta-hydrolase family hydrolase
VEGYELSASIDVQWLPDGDHSFKPRKSSGLSEAQNWQQAVAAADRFCCSLLSP